MTTKNPRRTPPPNFPPPNVQTIFADQPASLLVGPYVTRITLGLAEDDTNEYPRPVVTIAMPTVNMMRMVDDLKELFSDPEFKADSMKMLANDSKRYFGAKRAPVEEAKRPAPKKITKAD